MINRKGDVLLNLENTVLVLKDLVERHYEIDRVIADLGIKVIGVELTQPPETLGLRGQAFGDAYPQRAGTLLEYWVWTRPDSGVEDPAKGLWFNIGPLAIPGPQGIPGPAGSAGEPGHSTRWYIGRAPQEVANPVVGDLFLKNTDGTVYQYSETGWGYAQLTLRGPQGVPGVPGSVGPQGIPGPAGPAGPQGEAAPSIQLLGVLDSVDLLPEPSEQYTGLGYIVRSGDTSVIYSVFISTEEPHDYIWQIAGTVSGFSIVTVGGAVVANWNADTKLDKVTSTSEYERAYCIGTKGEQRVMRIGAGYPHANTLVVRQNEGQIQTGEPTEDRHATTKKYVDDGFVPRIRKATGEWAYVENYDGTVVQRQLQYGAAVPYTVPMRDAGGIVVVGTPTEDTHAATKKYVDDAVAGATPKLYRHTIYASCYGNDSDGTQHSINMHFEILSTQSTSASAYYVPVDKFVTLLAGPTAAAADVVAIGRCDDVTIGRVGFVKSDSSITAFNEYDEVIAAFQEENGVCEDHVTPIG